MGQFPAVFSARRYRAWTYGQTSREALSRWEPRRCPSPNRRTGSTFLRFVSMVAVRHWPISAIGAPQPPNWRVGPALPCGILAKTHLATGKHDSWRRWCRFLAQVSRVFGAGVWGVWRRCGKWVGTCATGGRRRPICGAGPSSKNTPAPRKPGTCAKEAWDLRGGAGNRSPAPTRNSRSMSMCP